MKLEILNYLFQFGWMKSGICSCGARYRVLYSLVGFGGEGLATTDSRTDYTLLSRLDRVLATSEDN